MRPLGEMAGPVSIMKDPAVIENHAATGFQTVFPSRARGHAGPGGEVGECRFAHAGFRISCYRKQRTARISAGVGGARRADRALYVSRRTALYAGHGAAGDG